MSTGIRCDICDKPVINRYERQCIFFKIKPKHVKKIKFIEGVRYRSHPKIEYDICINCWKKMVKIVQEKIGNKEQS